jgi:hypothetical protein
MLDFGDFFDKKIMERGLGLGGWRGMESGSGRMVVVSKCAGDHGACFGGSFVWIGAVLSQISGFVCVLKDFLVF